MIQIPQRFRAHISKFKASPIFQSKLRTNFEDSTNKIHRDTILQKPAQLKAMCVRIPAYTLSRNTPELPNSAIKRTKASRTLAKLNA